MTVQFETILRERGGAEGTLHHMMGGLLPQRLNT